jgi:hypothetical protein
MPLDPDTAAPENPDGSATPQPPVPVPAVERPPSQATSRQPWWHSAQWWGVVVAAAVGIATVLIMAVSYLDPRISTTPTVSIAPTTATMAATAPPTTGPPNAPPGTAPPVTGGGCSYSGESLALHQPVPLHKYGRIGIENRTSITYKTAEDMPCGGTISFDPHPQINFSRSTPPMRTRPTMAQQCATAGAGTPDNQSWDISTRSTGQYLCGPDFHGNTVVIYIKDASHVNDENDPTVTLVVDGFVD